MQDSRTSCPLQWAPLGLLELELGGYIDSDYGYIVQRTWNIEYTII